MIGDRHRDQAGSEEYSHESDGSASRDEPFDPFRYQVKTVPPDLRAELLHLELPLLRPDEITDPEPFTQRAWAAMRRVMNAFGDVLWARRVPVGLVLVGALLVCLSVVVALTVSGKPAAASRDYGTVRAASLGEPGHPPTPARTSPGRPPANPPAAAGEASARVGSLASGPDAPLASSGAGAPEPPPGQSQTTARRQGSSPALGDAPNGRRKLWMPD